MYSKFVYYVRIVVLTLLYYLDIISDFYMVKEAYNLSKIQKKWLEAMYIQIFCLFIERFYSYKLLIAICQK